MSRCVGRGRGRWGTPGGLSAPPRPLYAAGPILLDGSVPRPPKDAMNVQMIRLQASTPRDGDKAVRTGFDEIPDGLKVGSQITVEMGPLGGGGSLGPQTVEAITIIKKTPDLK